MEIIDVTRPLTEDILVYPGDVHPSFRQKDHGDYLTTDLHLNTHTGTHIDAPAHYLKNGDTIDTIPLLHLIGKCRVLDVAGAGKKITADNLKGRLEGATRILFKTSYSGNTQYSPEYPYLMTDAAQLITHYGIKCIGIDSPSVESPYGNGAVHRELLSKGCIIIELLDLSGIDEAEYMMAALPLRLEGLDGSPARVILMKGDTEVKDGHYC